MLAWEFLLTFDKENNCYVKNACDFTWRILNVLADNIKTHVDGLRKSIYADFDSPSNSKFILFGLERVNQT